jgi:hypothetical protein
MRRGEPSALSGVAARVEETRWLVEAAECFAAEVSCCAGGQCGAAACRLSEQIETGFQGRLSLPSRVRLACPACASHAVAGIGACP